MWKAAQMSLTLHPTKGVNPRLAHCPQCGKENSDILLLGTRDYYTTCSICKVKLIGGGKCPKCNRHGINRRTLPAGPLPGSICSDCEAKNKEAEEVVRAGGVFWRCSDCNSGGALRDCDLARAVREKMNIKPPDPCGVEFDKDDCPVCSEHAHEQ